VNPDRWARVEALYRAALARPPAERSSFVAEGSGEDADLRREVESMLEYTHDPALDATHTDDRTRTAPAAHREWGGLEVRDELGHGGYGTVHRAWDPTLARDVALKIIRLRTPEQAATVLREGQMLARIRHRNVVTVFSAHRVGDEVGLVMELIRGQNLNTTVRQNGPMGPEEATVTGISLCHALAAVHVAGLVHRDVKAHNVLRESGGRVVLTDFGAGREVGDLDDRPGMELTGTPLYLAPELFVGAAASPVSDLYSLGVLLFYLVTGQYPVAERTMSELAAAHAERRRRLLSDVRPDLPHAFVRVVERALEPDPKKRFQTAGAMLNALAEVIPSGPRPDDESGLGSDPREERVTPPVAQGEAGASGSRSGAGEQIGPGGFGRAALWILGGIAGIWLVGLLTSLSFDVTFRRSDFASDGPFDWLIYGLRALVAPAVYVLIALAAFVIIRAAGRVALAVLAPLRSLVTSAGEGLGGLAARVGLAEPATAAVWLVVAQVVALGAIGWAFSDVVAAFTSSVDVADAEQFHVLSPDSPAALYYRLTLTVAVLLMALSWRSLLGRKVVGRPVEAGTKIVGFGVLAIGVLMLIVPYRLMFQNRLPVVLRGETRCFDLGRNDTEILLYCPSLTSSPVMRAALDEEGLVATGEVVSPFSPPQD
jgi:hypothetical protein